MKPKRKRAGHGSLKRARKMLQRSKRDIKRTMRVIKANIEHFGCHSDSMTYPLYYYNFKLEGHVLIERWYDTKIRLMGIGIVRRLFFGSIPELMYAKFPLNEFDDLIELDPSKYMYAKSVTMGLKKYIDQLNSIEKKKKREEMKNDNVARR